MKKSLLFIGAMLLAFSANAQGVWTASEIIDNGGLADGTEITSVENLTIKVNGNNGNAWSAKASEGTFEYKGETYSQSYFQGGVNGAKTGAMTGCRVEITPAVAGTIDVLCKYGYNKPIWTAVIPSDQVAGLADQDVTSFQGPVWNQYMDTQNPGGIIIDAATTAAGDYQYNGLAMDVVPGNTYCIWVSGSKIMFLGVVFKASTTGLSAISVNEGAAQYFNLAGQRVGADAKGVVLVKQNGSVKKAILK